MTSSREPSGAARACAASRKAGLCHRALRSSGSSISRWPRSGSAWPRSTPAPRRSGRRPGLRLRGLLLRGYRIWPAILIAAFAANATNLITGFAANATAAVARNLARHRHRQHHSKPSFGAYLINRWSGGRATFESPAGVARFALICFRPHHALRNHRGDEPRAWRASPTGRAFGPIWLTWWLGDLAGALLITPVIVLVGGERLAARSTARSCSNRSLICAVACVIGRDRLQSARYDGTPGAAWLPGGAAAVVVGAAPRAARHRDGGAHPGRVRGLGHARRQRAVRPRHAQRIVPAAADVHDRRDGARALR